MKKILIVNPFGIGDVLFTRPLIAGLKAQYPSAAISYIGNHRTAPILRNDPSLDQVFSYERDEFVAAYRRSPIGFARKWFDFVRELRAQRYDVAFDLSLGSPLALALVFAGIRRRIGYDYKGRGRWLTDKILLKGYEGRHVSEYYSDLCSTNSASAPVTLPAFVVSAKERRWQEEFLQANGLTSGKYFIIHPGGGASWGKGAGLKRWPPEKFAQLADKMIENGMRPIILLGDQQERVLCEQIAGAMKQPSLVVAGKADLLQAAALMQAAWRVIVNDGGPLHVAVAFGARTVSIFGPVDPRVYGPYPAEGHVVIQKGLACSPCYRNFRMSDCTHQSCLKDLSVDEVLSAVLKNSY